MRREIVMVGAGGHAKVCIELLRAMGETVAFCIAGANATESCLGVPVRVGDDHLADLREAGYNRLFVAIGDGRLRDRLAGLGNTLGYELVNAVSPNAVISPSAVVGAGVAIMAGAVVNADSVIADLAIINTGAVVEHDCRIGRAVHIGPQSALAGNVSVGDGSLLGIGCKVIPEIVIGEYAVIGAGAVVISDIGDRATAVGVPARVLTMHRVDHG